MHAMMLLLMITPSLAYWAVDYTIVGTTASFTADNITSLTSLPSYTGFTFFAAPITVQADACLRGYYSYEDALTCIACPAGKFSSTDTAASVDTCIACESGKYSSTVGANSSTSCLSCPNSTYFAGTAGTSLGVCVACPANSYSYMGAKLLQACICSPGYSGPNGGPCSQCNPPYIPDGSGGGGMGMDFIDGGGGGNVIEPTFWCLYGQKNPCPTSSKAGQGASSLAQCLCDAGFYGDTTMGGPELTLCQVQMFFALFFSSCLLSSSYPPPFLPKNQKVPGYDQATRVQKANCGVDRLGGRLEWSRDS